MMSDVILSQYAIYDHPSDYPHNFVVRRWDVYDGFDVPVPNGNPVLAETLEGARAAVPPGLVNIGRMPGDDPVILEVRT